MRKRLLAAGVLAACIVSGCGKSTPQTGGPAAPRQLELAFVPKLLDNPVFQLAKRGAEDKAAKLGNVKILWRAPVEGDVAKQTQIIEDLTSRGVDGIAVSCIDPEGVRKAIDKAVDAGIPVITFDSDSPKSKRVCYYGTDDVKGGRILAEHLVRALGAQPAGKVAILTGLPDAYNTNRRIDGAMAVLNKHPKIQVLETQYCNDDTAESVAKIEALMQMHPDLAGWIFVGGWPLFSPKALACLKRPGAVKVTSFDTLPPEWPFLEKGYVEVLVGQQYYGWGAESVVLLKKIIEGHKVPEINYADVEPITRAQLGAYKEQWHKWFPADRPK